MSYRDDLKVIAKLQKELEKNPDAVKDILVAANIIDKDGQLKAPYNGEHDWLDFKQTEPPKELHTYEEWNLKGFFVQKGQKGIRRKGKILFDKTQVQKKDKPRFSDEPRIYNRLRGLGQISIDESESSFGHHRFSESQFDGDRSGYYTETVSTPSGSTVSVDRYENGRSRVHWGGPCGYTDYDEFGEEC